MGRIVIDTNVLWDPLVLEQLRRADKDLVLPVVAFAERARQYWAQQRSLESLWDLLAHVGATVESMTPVEALRRSLKVGERAWPRLNRDAFIAGHVGPDDVLWTRDVEDFVAVGVPRNQIQDTANLSAAAKP